MTTAEAECLVLGGPPWLAFRSTEDARRAYEANRLKIREQWDAPIAPCFLDSDEDTQIQACRAWLMNDAETWGASSPEADPVVAQLKWLTRLSGEILADVERRARQCAW